MRILRETSRTYKGKKYFKYKVNLPKEVLAKSHLSAGDELNIKVKKHEITLKKK